MKPRWCLQNMNKNLEEGFRKMDNNWAPSTQEQHEQETHSASGTRGYCRCTTIEARAN